MAQRRMFSPKIVDSDAFLDMPISTQALYFHLGMNADDDGFVNPRKIMRAVGASDDDLKILIGKRFVLTFENGVIVIKHWKINNLIKTDRYNETIYIEQKGLITTKENGSYTELLGKRFQKGSKSVPQVRLGKVRLGKDINTYTKEFEEFYDTYPLKIGKGAAFRAWEKINQQELMLLARAIKNQKEANHFQGYDGKDYIPHPATWINQRRWEDEVQVKTIKTNSITIG